jgi:hypothetical protein
MVVNMEEKKDGFKEMPIFKIMWVVDGVQCQTGLFKNKTGDGYSVKLGQAIPAGVYINVFKIEPRG